MDKKDETYFTRLVARYLSGEATGLQIQELARWLEGDPQRRKWFQKIVRAWQVAGDSHIRKKLDPDKEWVALEARIREKAPKHASGNGLTMDFTRWTSRFMVRAAAALILIAIPAYLLFHYLNDPEMITARAEGKLCEVCLPDGSVVTLNRHAILEYPEEFDAEKRVVSLQGEGFFSVERHSRKPFLIRSGEVRVRVLGTSFNLNTRTSNNIMELMLVEGRVEIYFKGQSQETRQITPGERAAIDQTGQHIEISRNTDPNFLSWKTRLFIFKDDPLSEVIRVLDRAYPAGIRIISKGSGNDPGSCRLTATFDNQPLESVLEIIATTLDLEVNNKEGGFVLSGPGCY
ncbi:MAG: FecR domain-containing protein [Bacteroidales bacterium]